MAELEESADTIETEQCVAFKALSRNTTNLHQCGTLSCAQRIKDLSVSLLERILDDLDDLDEKCCKRKMKSNCVVCFLVPC